MDEVEYGRRMAAMVDSFDSPRLRLQAARLDFRAWKIDIDEYERRVFEAGVWNEQLRRASAAKSPDGSSPPHPCQ